MSQHNNCSSGIVDFLAQGNYRHLLIESLIVVKISNLKVTVEYKADDLSEKSSEYHNRAN
jgi:hypothetical protein